MFSPVFFATRDKNTCVKVGTSTGDAIGPLALDNALSIPAGKRGPYFTQSPPGKLHMSKSNTGMIECDQLDTYTLLREKELIEDPADSLPLNAFQRTIERKHTDINYSRQRS